MGLDKQIVPLSLATGINTKVDEFQLNTDALATVENVVYTGINEFRKRDGYKAVTDYTIEGPKYTNPKSTSFYNKELQLYTDKKLLAYSSTSNSWVEKGLISNTRVTSYPVLRNNAQQSEVSVANVSNIKAYAWKDSRGGVRASVIDAANNNLFLHDIEISATGTHPKIETQDNVFYIFYADGTDLKYRSINSGELNGPGVETTIISDLDASKVYNVKLIGNKIFIIYHSTDSGGSMGIMYIDNSGNLSGIILLPGEEPSVAVSICTNSQFQLAAFYSNGSEVKFLSYSYTLGAQLIAPTLVETIADATNLSTIFAPSGLYALQYEIKSTTPSNYYIKKSTITTAGVPGTPSILVRSVGLASEQFIYNDIIYSMVVFDTQLQATYFVISDSGQIITKISDGVGGGVLPSNTLPKVLQDGTDYTIPSQIKGQGTTGTAAGVLFFLTGVNSSVFSFDTQINYQQEVLGKNLYITGGILLNYDGAEVTEDGFHVYPENLGTISTTNAGTTTLGNGKRQYSAVYMWTDNRGQIHRSAPSVPVSYENTSGANATNHIPVPTLRLSAKNNVIIELYRTEDLGNTFYKVTSTTAPIYNDKTVNSITINDSIGDTDLLDNEILYTTGNVLENIAAPAASIITSWKNRVVLSGLEDQNGIIYSKVREEGKPIGFNDALTLRVDDRNSQITALGVLDDKLIIFKTSSMYVESGEGPNNTGQASDFYQPNRIASDVGCISPDSVVITPQGLMFQSEKGIYLLDRALDATYIGAEVEKYNHLKITSAILVPTTNQIRFTTDSDKTLMYDYFLGRWSVFTNMPASDSHIQQDTYAYLNRTEGKIFVETPGYFLDNGEQILITFESGWVSFAGLQGYQRVYKFLCLGKLFSRHKLKISAAYDFTNAYIHDRIIDSNQFTNSVPYGEGGNYGVQSPYGTAGKPYQFRFDMKKQKCQSIKLKFEELENEVLGQGLSISALTFEIGGKKGLFKINQGAVFGAGK